MVAIQILLRIIYRGMLWVSDNDLDAVDLNVTIMIARVNRYSRVYPNGNWTARLFRL